MTAMMIMRMLIKFCRREDGVTSVEYCVMVAMIVIAAIVGIMATGGGAAGWWGNIDTDLNTYGF